MSGWHEMERGGAGRRRCFLHRSRHSRRAARPHVRGKDALRDALQDHRHLQQWAMQAARRAIQRAAHRRGEGAGRIERASVEAEAKPMSRWKKLSCARRSRCWGVEDSAVVISQAALQSIPASARRTFLESLKRRYVTIGELKKNQRKSTPGRAAPASAGPISTPASALRANFLTPTGQGRGTGSHSGSHGKRADKSELGGDISARIFPSEEDPRPRLLRIPQRLAGMVSTMVSTV